MKNNVIESGDNVSYYHGYYTHGCGVNEYGDPEIIDVHEEKYGKVLIIVGNEALCVFYNYADNEHVKLNRVFVNELHTQWFPIDKLEKEDEIEKEYLFERPEPITYSYELDNYPDGMTESDLQHVGETENPDLPF